MGIVDKLKSLFRRRGVEVEYQAHDGEGPVVVPAGPPTGQMPPGAPAGDLGVEEKSGDDERS